MVLQISPSFPLPSPHHLHHLHHLHQHDPLMNTNMMIIQDTKQTETRKQPYMRPKFKVHNLSLTFLTFILLLVAFWPAPSDARKWNLKTSGFIKTTFQREVKITDKDKDKLVNETVNIIIETNDVIPVHYELTLDFVLRGIVDSPSGLNATANDNVQLVRGVRKNALLFDKSSFVVVNRGTTMVSECFYDLSYCKDGYSIGFWANFPKLPKQDHVYISSGGDLSDNHGVAMSLNPRGDLTFTFKTRNGHEWKFTTTDSYLIVPNKWYHILATWSERHGITLYIDGKVVRGQPANRDVSSVGLREPRQFWLGRSLKSSYYPMEQSFIIDEVHFWMEHMDERDAREIGSILIYRLPISTIRQIYSTNTASQEVRIEGKPQFVSEGKTVDALEFNGKTDYLSDDISSYCFSNISNCFNGFLMAAWMKFGPFQNDGHYISTGDYGMRLYYKDKALVGEAQFEDQFWNVSWKRGAEGQWYFVELSMSPDENLILYIDQWPVSMARLSHSKTPTHELLTNDISVGRSSHGSVYAPFTVDDFELWYGDRSMLETLGYIIRGRPIRYHIPMDYIDGTKIPHQNLSIEVYRVPKVVTGKVKGAINLDGKAQYIFIPSQQGNVQPCLWNLNFCKSGSTFSMWLKPGQLDDGMEIFSTGTYGFKMWQDGLTKVSARVADREWSLATNHLVPDKWQFIELSFDPSSRKGKLQLYIDGKLVGESDAEGYPRPREEQIHFDGIYIGRGDGTRRNSKFGFFTIDEVEYWFANRDYLTKFNFIQRGQLSDHIHLTMDEIRNNKLVHHFLDVSVHGNPDLVGGKVANAIYLNGIRQYLDLGSHRDSCLGDLAQCQEGVTGSMWANFNSFPDHGYLFSNGGGIQVYTAEGNKLFVVIDIGGKKWQVSVPGLKTGKWYFFEYTWRPDTGLQVYINNRLVGMSAAPSSSTRGFTSRSGRVLIGAANSGEPDNGRVAQNADATVDEFEYWFNDRDSLIASKSIVRDLVNYILFSFETQVWTRVYHPDFNVLLHNGAHITKGRVGNGLLLEGTEEYVSFGDQRKICMGNLALCPQGLTISMLINPRSLPNRGYILSGAPYSIYTEHGKVYAHFTNGTKVWNVSSDALKTNKWQQLEVSWHPQKGLQMFIDDRLVASKEVPVEADRPPYITDHVVYLGRPTDDIQSVNAAYANASIDELQFWYASRDALDLDPVINRIILDMDIISNNKLINPYQVITAHGGSTTVPAINISGVLLSGNRQYLQSSDSQLICLGSLENCRHGFTLRFKLKPNQVLDNQYLLSSAPLDIYIHNKRLIVEMRTPDKMWKVTSRELSPGNWYQVDLSWSPVDGAFLYINGEKVDSNTGLPNPGGQYTFNPSKHFFIGKANTNMVFEQYGNAIFDDMQFWEAKRDLLIWRNLIHTETLTISTVTWATVTRSPSYTFVFPPIYPGSNQRLIFDGRTWYIYDISQLPPGYHNHNHMEKLSIKFLTNKPDGLLWFNGDQNNNVHLVLKEGILHFVVVKNGEVQRYEIEHTRLDDGRWHEIFISRNGREVDIEVDGQNQRQQIDYEINFLRPEFTYIGGSGNTGDMTKWFINSNFDGKIREFWFSGDNMPTDLDFKGLVFVRPHPPFLNINGTWLEETDNYVGLQHPRPVYFNISVDDEKVRPREIIPITFVDGRSHIVIPGWQPPKSPVVGSSSLELKYRTISPRGILLFIQRNDRPQSNALIELYDGVPYLVADFGRGYQRLPFGNRPLRTDDNRPHYVRLLSSDNSLKLTLDDDTYTHYYVAGRNRSLDVFSSPGDQMIHLGGVDHASRLPWHSWNEQSREGFIGCVWDLRYNSGETLDLAGILQKLGETAGIRMQCRAPMEYCSTPPCRNGGLCHEVPNGYFCDCSDTQFTGRNCETHSKFVSFGGNDRVEISYTPTKITHTNDISLRFKTPKENALLFSATNYYNDDIIKVTLERGIGSIESRFGGAAVPTYTSFECPQPLNDNLWHTIHIKRRANHLEAYVDDCPKTTIEYPGQDYKFRIDRIILGKDEKSFFTGHLQNFFIDGNDIFHIIDIGHNNEMTITTSVTTTEIEKLIPFHPITIRANTNAHLVMNPLQLLGNTKLQFMFKTSDPDVILLYNPGYDPDFFAVELTGGYLHVAADDGTGMKEVTSSAGYLSDSKWHQVSFEQKPNNRIEIVVDERYRDNLQFQQSRHTLDLTDKLYVGSVPGPLIGGLSEVIRSRRGFSGCLASLIINRILYTLDSDSYLSPFITAGCSNATGYCVSGICKNGGQCTEGLNGFSCNCDWTSFSGPRCTDESQGFIFSEKGGKGIVIYTLEPPQTTSGDYIALGFITHEHNGTLIKIDGSNLRDFIELKMVNGHVVATYKIGERIHEIVEHRRAFNDGKYHRLLFIRSGHNASLRIDDYPDSTAISSIDGRDTGHFHEMSVVKIGGDLSRTNDIINYYNGIIAGVYINGIRVIDSLSPSKTGDAWVAIHPFHVEKHHPTERPTPGPGHPTPVIPTLPPDIKPPVDPYPPISPPEEPSNGGGGGIGWETEEGVIVNPEGEPIFEPVVGLEGAPVSAIDAPGVRAAGVAGAMLGALLLASSAMWALYKLKPGRLGGLGGPKSATAGGASKINAPLLHGENAGTGGGTTDLSNFFPPVSSATATGGLDSTDSGTMHRAMQTDSRVVMTGGTGGTIQGYHISGGGVGGVGGGVGGGGTAPPGYQTVRSTASDYRHDSSMQGLQEQSQAQPLNQSVTYSYERSQTLTQQGGMPLDGFSLPSSPTGHLGTGQFSMRNVDLSYGGFNQQDIFTQQQQQRMLQQQQQLLGASSTLGHSTLGQGTSQRNFMTAEEIRVDCVQMTNNGRYVVTGSNCGPPQVWDLKSGELVKVMRGDELSSTDLHLANGDTLLVGQVAELEPVDMVDANRVHHRRLQIWDFETGKPVEMSRTEMCTASCMMNDGERIVLGRTEKFGGGTAIVVWDILANEPMRQIKCDASVGFADYIAYLNASKDNRYIIAGFQNSYDGMANYVTFDLASPDVGAGGLRVAAIDAAVEVTALLNDKEAVTGTRRGELVVWSMKTGRQLRSIGGPGLLAHQGEIKEVAVSKDNQLLVSASVDGTLKLWDVDSENLLHTLVGHRDEVWCATISPDNELIGSGSRDGTIRLWKVSDGASVAAIDAGMTIFKVLLSNNKKTVVALGDKGGARKLIMLRVVRSTATIDRRTGLVNP